MKGWFTQYIPVSRLQMELGWERRQRHVGGVHGWEDGALPLHVGISFSRKRN